MKNKSLIKKILAYSIIFSVMGITTLNINTIDVSAANSRDLVYVSIPLESTNGSDLYNKIVSNPTKYFVLKNDSSNGFSEKTLTKANWESILDTTFPSSVNNAYWNTYFVTNKDKLEFEIVDGGTRTCHHYAAYEVLGARNLVASGRWWTSCMNVNTGEGYYNGDGGWRYQPQGISAGGGWVQAPAKDFIGYNNRSDYLRFSVSKFDSDFDAPDHNSSEGWDDAWGVWTAKERAISYSSVGSGGKLLGAGTAMCSYIDENWDRYLPWLIAYPTDNGGSHSAYCGIAEIMFPETYNSTSRQWNKVGGSQYVKLKGNNMYVSYTWGDDNVRSNVPVTISALGTWYSSCWWNVYNEPIHWYPSGDDYYAPDMVLQQSWTNPAYGGYGMHVNSATARLLGINACQYHTPDAHVDLDGAYLKDGSYNLTCSVWKHNVHFYQLKVYLKKDRTITYNANGGTGSVPSQTELIGTPIVIADNKFSRTGYTIDDRIWNTKSDGSGEWYLPGKVYNGDDDLVLYAIWIPNTYSVNVLDNKPEDATSDISHIK